MAKDMPIWAASATDKTSVPGTDCKTAGWRAAEGTYCTGVQIGDLGMLSVLIESLLKLGVRGILHLNLNLMLSSGLKA